MSKHRIIVVRHGESEEDINPGIKSAVDDPARLTPYGRQQVRNSALDLLDEYIGFETYLAYHSRSARVIESKDVFLESLKIQSPIETILEPSIRNLDWGQTSSENAKLIEKERYKVGVLNFQFPGGDNTPTYVRGIAIFCEELLVRLSQLPSACATIFTHGFALRVIVKHLLGMTDDEFRYLSNPKNCFTCIIDIDFSYTSPNLQLRTDLPKIQFSLD